MDKPNIYSFATSELSQDATLAYLLSWAKPEYRERYPVLNRLGEHLLRTLGEASAEARSEPNPLDNRAIQVLEVGTQRDRMDVWAEINDSLILVIEDKTNTCEHSDQIAR